MAKIGMSQEEVDKQRKESTIMIAVILGITAAYLASYIISMKNVYHVGVMDGFSKTMDGIMSMHLLFRTNPIWVIQGIGMGALIGFLSFFFMDLDEQKRSGYIDQISAGSGGFMSKKELQTYAKEFISQDPPALIDESKFPLESNVEKDKGKYSENMIMSNSFCRPLNSRRLIGNNNIMVVGGAGTGKSRFFIKPNVLQMNASYVITDPSGEMIFSLGKTLKDHGYKIKIFNISDMAHSNCYNPINYIRDEAGVNMLIKCFITNTTEGEGGGDNQFFVDAEKLLYSACLFYLIDHCEEDSRKNFAGILTMINSSSVNEQDPNAKSPLDSLFDKLSPNDLAWKYYKAFKQAAGKTLKSIIISCVTRMQPFMTPQVANLTKRDDLELGKIGEEKTALFIITPQADRTYAFLASMLYSQLFETLYFIGEQQKARGESEQMKIPVRCMMDEFANIGEVPEFPSKLSTMRKYNISASIVLQDNSQIEAMYKDTYKTLVGNCSTIVFLGTQEQNTLEYFSKMLGNMTIKKKNTNISEGKQKSSTKGIQRDKREVMTPDELGRLSPDECIVFTQNRRPVKDKKYKYERHPYYSQTADANNDYGFKYNTLSAYNNSSTVDVDSVLKAQREAAAYKERAAEKADADTDVLMLDEDKEENGYNKIAEEYLIKAVTDYSMLPACVMKINEVPLKILCRLASYILKMFNMDKPVILFTEVPGRNGKQLAGVGIAGDGFELAPYMQTKHTPGVNQKNGYCYTVINSHDFEEYKSIVLENLDAQVH